MMMGLMWLAHCRDQASSKRVTRGRTHDAVVSQWMFVCYALFRFSRRGHSGSCPAVNIQMLLVL